MNFLPQVLGTLFVCMQVTILSTPNRILVRLLVQIVYISCSNREIRKARKTDAPLRRKTQSERAPPWRQAASGPLAPRIAGQGAHAHPRGGHRGEDDRKGRPWQVRARLPAALRDGQDVLNRGEGDEWLESVMWPDGPPLPWLRILPRLGHARKSSPMTRGCNYCCRRFSIKSVSVKKASRLSLVKWATAIYEFSTNLHGISATQLRRALGVAH